MLYGYTRVSTTEQVQGTSLEEQERRIRGIALLRDVDVAEIFTDGGISGSVPLERRPAGASLLAALHPGDALVCSKLDRLFRSSADAMVMAERFKAEGIDLVIADIGIDSVTRDGVSKLFFSMMACFAEFERSRIKERQIEGRKAKRGKDGFLGGKRPFGYQIQGEGRESVLVPVPEEQEIIQQIRELREGGMSLQRISDHVQANGFFLSHMGVSRILQRAEA